MSQDIIALSDRIKELSYSTGTGDFSLDGAAAGFSSFGNAYQNNDALFYAITDGSNYEIGSGQYIVVGPNDYLRRFPFRSSNSNNLVNFTAGVKEVYVTYPGQYSVFTASGLGNFQRPKASGVAFWQSSQILDYDSNFIWDATNNRLGINIANPKSALHIGGTVNESILTVSGVVLGGSGIWFSGINPYVGGVQREPFMRNELDPTTGTSDVFSLSGVVDQRLLFKKVNAGLVFAGPPSGCASPPCLPGYPSFRALTAGDIPELDYLASAGPCSEGQIPFCNGSGQLTFDTNLIWDTTNNYLGVNTATPTKSLDVTGHGRVTGDFTVGGKIIFSDNSTISGAYLAGSGLSLYGGRQFNIGNMFQLSDSANTGWVHQANTVTITGVNGILTSYNTGTKTLTITGQGVYDKWVISDQYLSSGSILTGNTVYFSGVSGITTEFSNNTLKISAGTLSGNLVNFINTTSGNLHTEIVNTSGWAKSYIDGQVISAGSYTKWVVADGSGNKSDVTQADTVYFSGIDGIKTGLISLDASNFIVTISGGAGGIGEYYAGTGLAKTGNTFYTYGTGLFTNIYFGTSSAEASSAAIKVGYNAGGSQDTSKSDRIVIGNNSATSSSGALHSINIGESAGQYSQLSSGSIYVGWQAGKYSQYAKYNNFVGTLAGSNSNNSTENNFIGYQAGNYSDNNIGTNAIGTNAGYLSSGATYNNYIGHNAGYKSSGTNYSTFVGYYSGSGLKTDNSIILKTNANLNNGATWAGTNNYIIEIADTIHGRSDNRTLRIGADPASYSEVNDYTLSVKSNSPSKKAVGVLATSSQTANLQEWADSSLNVPTYVDKDGFLHATGGLVLDVGSPVSTTNKLYNNGGNLYWNGNIVSAGSAYTAGSGLTLHGTQFNMGNMWSLSDKSTSGWVHQADRVAFSGINGVKVSFNGIGTNDKTVLISGVYRTKNVRTENSDTTLLLNDEVLFISSNPGGSVQVNLPTAIGNQGKEYYIKRVDTGSSYSVVIDGYGSETIDGALSKTLTNNYEAVLIISNNSNWFVF